MHTIEVIAKVLQYSFIRGECFEESIIIIASRELGSKFGEYLLDEHRQFPSSLETLQGAGYAHLGEAVARHSPHCTVLCVPLREDGVVARHLQSYTHACISQPSISRVEVWFLHFVPLKES